MDDSSINSYKNSNRRDYLKRKLDNTENIYNGVIWSYKEELKHLKETNIDETIVKNRKNLMLEQFYINFPQFYQLVKEGDLQKVSKVYSNKDIVDFVFDKKLIINNNSVYVFCVNGMKSLGMSVLSLHLTQSFIKNWDKYENYMARIFTGSLDPLTISTLTSIDIMNGEFKAKQKEKQNKPKGGIDLLQYITNDIQFIILIDKPEDWFKGFYLESVQAYISLRNTAGLITIVLFRGTEDLFNTSKYDEFREYIESTRSLIVKTVGITQQEENKSTPQQENDPLIAMSDELNIWGGKKQ